MNLQPLGLSLVALAIVLLALAVLIRRRSGLPWGRVISDDVRQGRPLERPLISRRYGLTGRPDYLIERHGQTIPVELKPTRHAQQPYESDLMQLAAYCLLLEESTGQPPPYGLLRYADATFRLSYTAAVRAELLAILDKMHDLLEADNVARSHREARRCAGCGLLDVCDDALV